MLIPLTANLTDNEYRERCGRVEQSRRAQCVTQEEFTWLTHVEYLLNYAEPPQPDEAFKIYERLSDNARASTFGREVAEYVEEAAFFIAAERAMRAAITTGQCKLSRSGQEVIFSQPQCGRNDLSGVRRIAEAQLRDAGVDIENG